MKKKTNFLATIMTAIVLIVVILPGSANAQQVGSGRTELQRHNLSIPGREVVQVRVDLEPGILSHKHTHPGEEIVYVVEGLLEYTVEGRAPVTLKAGEVLFIPAGAAHTAKNVGTGKGSEIATYIVDKTKPLVTIVK